MASRPDHAHPRTRSHFERSLRKCSTCYVLFEPKGSETGDPDPATECRDCMARPYLQLMELLYGYTGPWNPRMVQRCHDLVEAARPYLESLGAKDPDSGRLATEAIERRIAELSRTDRNQS